MQRALVGYPLYDPPHKTEERLLPKWAALENFDYFMSVRLERTRFLISWLSQNFGVDFSLDMKGVQALGGWGNKYAGLLPVGSPSDFSMSAPFFTYRPAWTEEYAGYNVMFDMGTAYGEALIARLPTLHWSFSPTEGLLPKTARAGKREFGSDFRRPQLAEPSSPTFSMSPHGKVWGFCHQMRIYTTDCGDRKLLMSNISKRDRLDIMNFLVNNYQSVVKLYPYFDPDDLRSKISEIKYADIVDSEGNGDD